MTLVYKYDCRMYTLCCITSTGSEARLRNSQNRWAIHNVERQLNYVYI